MLETIAQSQCVALGLVPRRSAFALAPVYLRTKGCSETNDLAPVSQSRRTRDGKGKGSAVGVGVGVERDEGNEKMKFHLLLTEGNF